MPQEDKRRRSLNRVRRLKIYLIASYALIVAAAILFVSLLTVWKTDSVLKNKVSSMASSLNVQMRMNMDSYLSRMETIATLAFAVEESYTYDATDPSNDEYEAINTEKVISDKLYSLCIMENFVDYGIVYRNNHMVGKISNGTVALFGDRLFEDLHAMVTKERTSDGWAAGYQGNFKRIYYVKEIHENAVLVISFYATELVDVFDSPETMKDMEIRLTDQDYNIIYSSASGEVGGTLGEALLQRVGINTETTVMDNDYLVTESICTNGWYVICSEPTAVILDEKNEMQLYIFVVAAAAVMLAIAVGTILSIKLSDPVTTIVSNLDREAQIDQLTGIFNKHFFEEHAENALQRARTSDRHAVILVDVDDFKAVNDTLGHAYGDEVLRNIGDMLRTVFDKEDYLGRIGGDEFCVFLNRMPEDESYPAYVSAKCETLCEAFRNSYTGADGGYKISASIGAALSPAHGNTFQTLYAAADKALYASKRLGKDTYSVFEGKEAAEE